MLIDAGSDEQVFTELVTRLVQAGVDVLQLRDRSVDDRTLLSRARLGAEIARQFGKLFIVNDRADLAVAADTDGVHVGQDELPVAETRQIVGPSRLVGVSTHSIGQARDAVADGADYIGCGPVFAGRTKTFESYVGTEFPEAKLLGEIEIPAFAIGGIDASNINQVVEAGFHRIAVTGAVRDADDPAAAVTSIEKTSGALLIASWLVQLAVPDDASKRSIKDSICPTASGLYPSQTPTMVPSTPTTIVVG